MRRFVWVTIILAVLAGRGLGQSGACYDRTFVDNAGKPLRNVSARLCTEPASGAACMPLAPSVYADRALTNPLSNPFTSDNKGNVHFCVAQGPLYHLQVNGIDYANLAVDDAARLILASKVLPFSASVSFDANLNSLFLLTLTGDVTTSTVTGGTRGRLLATRICQDGTGNHSFTWPTDFFDPPTLTATASGCTTTSFIYDGSYWRTLSGNSSGTVATADVTWNYELPLLTDSGRWRWHLSARRSMFEVSCDTDAGGSATLNMELRSRTTPNVAGTPLLNTPLTCGPTVDCNLGTGCTRNFSLSTIPADALLTPTFSAVNAAGLRVYVTLQPR